VAYTFTDSAVATAAQLNTLLPPQVAQSGVVRITPVANTPTSVRVNFASPFPTPPKVFTTPVSLYPGSAVKGTAVTDVTTTGFTLWIYRTTTATTSVCWHAWGQMSAAFVDGSPAPASLLNAGVGQPTVKAGRVSITPTAGTATSATVTFGTAFAEVPTVVLIPSSIVVGTTVDGWSVTDMSPTSFKAWIRRSTSAATPMLWIALGRA
jgi:hypothetical protein